jgi:hypothetical protein
MSKLSRRTLVTTVAALPVLAMPALASDAIGPNHPDAELLRLRPGPRPGGEGCADPADSRLSL